MAKEEQRILLTPRNPHCGQRNGCDGNRMLSSQYQLRYPPILAEASSISEQYPTIPTRYPTSSLRHCLGRVPWIANNCTRSKNSQMRKRWIFDQVWYGRDMAWAWCEMLAAGGSDIDHFPQEGHSTPQCPPQNTSSCHIQQFVYCHTSTLLGPHSSGR